MSHNLLCATSLDIVSTSCAYAFLLWGVPLLPRHAIQRARRHRSLDILTAREPVVFLFAPLIALLSLSFMSYDADSGWLAKGRIQAESLEKSRFLQVLLVCPHVGPEALLGFLSFRKICWSRWSINIYEKLGRKTTAVSLPNDVSAPCCEGTKIWGHGFSLIICFRSPNFAQNISILNQMNRKLGLGRRNFSKWNVDHREMEVQPSAEQNGGGILSSGCLAYQSRWLEVPSWRRFDSCQFAAKAESWHWTRNGKFCK